VSEDRVSAALALVPAKSREPSWKHHLEGAIGDLADRATEAAAPLAKALDASLDPKGLRVVDKEATEHYLRGRAFLEKWDEPRNLARAEGELRQAIDDDPQLAEAYAALAGVLWTRYGESKEPALIDETQALVARAIELDNQLPLAHLHLGVLQLARGLNTDALASFARAQALAPADDSICRRIAQAYVSMGRDDEADAMFERAIELRPGLWQHYNSQGAFSLRRGKVRKAARLFKRVTEIRPESDVGWSNLAAAYLFLGEPEKAEGALRAVLRLKPSPRLHNNLGVALYAGRRFEEAIEEWRLVMRQGAGRAETLVNLGDAFRQLGRKAEAEQHYLRAAELAQKQLDANPADEESRSALALASAGLGRCRQARTLAGDLASLPRDAVAAQGAASALAICGYTDEARKQVAVVVELGFEGYVRTNPDLESLADATESRTR